MSDKINTKRLSALLMDAFYGRGRYKESDILVIWAATEICLPIDVPWEIAFVASGPLATDTELEQRRNSVLEGPCRAVCDFDAATDNWELYLARPAGIAGTTPWILLLEAFDPLDVLQGRSVRYFSRIDAPLQWAGDWSVLTPRVVDPREMSLGN